MSHLRGRGMGAGMALGISVVVQTKNGMPGFPSMPPSVMQRLASRKQTEKADIVLAARDLSTALSFVDAITWGQVVGIASESEEYDGPYPNIPVVVGVSQLLELVEQDVLVILDAERGVVETDPDGVRLAQYQADQDYIAPKRRIFLDDVHLPAQTIDGHTLQVIASIATESQLAEAMSQGADAMYIPFDCSLLPDDSDETIVRTKMMRLIELAAGKPLIISDDYALPAMLLLESAALADITIAVPPRYELEGYGLTELEDELEAAETECAESELLISNPRLAADVPYYPENLSSSAVTEWVDSLALRGAERIIFHQFIKPTHLWYFEYLCAAATVNTIPVFLETTQFEGDAPNAEISGRDFRLLLGSNVGGFVIRPNAVIEFKQAIRACSFSECRREMWSFLK